MIGGIDITPDKWYNKLWFYPLIIALCIGWTIYGFIECAVIWLKRKITVRNGRERGGSQ